MYPTIFQIGPFVISTMWVFIILGTYIYLKLLIKQIQKKREDFKFLYDHSTLFILSFLVGSRLLHIAENRMFYFESGFSLQSFLSIFAFWDRGFSFWGGLILFLIVLFYMTRVDKEGFKKWMDYLTVPFLYILPIMYVGKLFDGAGYGTRTDLPWGITFTNLTVPVVTPVHPTQLYTLILSIGIIFLTRYYFSKYEDTTKVAGARATFIIGCIALALCIEGFFRGDPAFALFGIRFSIYVTAAIVISSFFYFRKLTSSYM